MMEEMKRWKEEGESDVVMVVRRRFGKVNRIAARKCWAPSPFPFGWSTSPICYWRSVVARHCGILLVKLV